MNRAPNDVLHLAVAAYEQNLSGNLNISAQISEEEKQRDGYEISYYSPHGSFPKVHLDARISEDDGHNPNVVVDFYDYRTVAGDIPVMLSTHYYLEDGVLKRARSLMHQDYENHSPGKHPDDYSDEKARPATRYTAAALAYLAFSRAPHSEQTKNSRVNSTVF